MLGGVLAATADEELVRIPGSARVYPRSRINAPFDPPDWFPGTHPPQPEVVKHGDPDKGLWACAVCHLANGNGHPESAAINGLPADYLYRQLKAFQGWERIDHTGVMMMFIRPHRDEDLRLAAEYFAQIPPQPVVSVVEAETVPVTYVDRIYMRLVKDPDHAEFEPVGQRIITVPADQYRVQARDPTARFIAYVPKGYLARGRAIAEHGTDQVAACVDCHGAELQGTTLGPRIAGQFPDYLVRQLRAFKIGTRRARADPEGIMGRNVRYLAEDDILAVAAFVASLPRN